MEQTDPIVIVGSARTPIGRFQGVFSSLSATTLGSEAIKAALKRSNLTPNDIDEVIMGCVLSAGLGQAPARQASLAAGIPTSTGCTTINKVCASSMKAVMLAHDLLIAKTNTIMLAGGMESMTNTPYLLEKARSGYRIGHHRLIDSMYLDGLEDAYDRGQLMGLFAEKTAEKYGFSRQAQDDYAIESLSRAKKATDAGWFLNDVEIHPVEVSQNQIIEHDEQPLRAKPEKIPLLKPSFHDQGSITAANSSSISDGGAALILMPLSEAKKRNLKPIAKILAHATHAQEPNWFTTAPVGAVQKLLKKLNWNSETPDLYEINEAFAAVALAAQRDLNIPHNKLNVHGGSCALGHPLGATGARIITTLLGALKRLNKPLGIAALCIGGGEATAIAIERMND